MNKSYRIMDCCENCKFSRGIRNLPPYHCIIDKSEIDMTGMCNDYEKAK